MGTARETFTNRDASNGFPSARRWALWLALICVTSSAQVTESTAWVTGDDFQRQLEWKSGVTWSSQKLGTGLNNLAASHRIAIWLDRQVDPEQQPVFSVNEMPFEQCLQTLAAGLDLGTCRVGSVIYMGKKPVASKLATIAGLKNEEAAQLPADVRSRLNKLQASQWEILTSPRELLDELAREMNVRFLGLEKIPHDLWGARSLPPLTFSERLTLILAGFELSFQFEDGGKTVRLTSLPDKPVLRREYPGRGDPVRLLPQLAKAAPGAEIKREGTRILVTGTAEEQEIVRRMLGGERVRVPTGEAKTVYTMSAKNQALGTVLKTLQVRAQLEIVVDPSVQKKLYELVSFDVKDATLEELLTAALQNRGVRFRLTEKTLEILPSE